MYHRIRSERCPVPGDDADETRYAVDVDSFRWQMETIAEMGLLGVPLDAVMRGLTERDALSGRDVVITFDDGNRSDYEHALPILTELGFGATFFVTGHRVGAAGGIEPDMIRTLSESGMDVGSHAVTHRFLTTLVEADERRELSQSKEQLAAITGKPVRFFAPPGGRYSGRTVRILKDLGYEAACTSRFGYNRFGTDLFALRRLPVALATGREAFVSLLERPLGFLVPAYLRATSLAVARRVVGEGAYGRLRSLLLKE
jgi:peptidoglycan/xylan/chitin deacetylase (PgdA/CDA1 family)